MPKEREASGASDNCSEEGRETLQSASLSSGSQAAHAVRMTCLVLSFPRQKLRFCAFGSVLCVCVCFCPVFSFFLTLTIFLESSVTFRFTALPPKPLLPVLSIQTQSLCGSLLSLLQHGTGHQLQMLPNAHTVWGVKPHLPRELLFLTKPCKSV